MPNEIRELQKIVPFSTNGADTSGGNVSDFTVLRWLGTAGQHAPAYWSTSRDKWLRGFYLKSDYLKIATKTFTEKACGVPFRIQAKDHSVKAHVALAAQIEDDILYNSGMLKGFFKEFAKFTADYLTQDNGAFFLVMGGGKADGPIVGAVAGLLHLDAQYCHRTGDLEYPVVYEHQDGKRYKLHYTRVIFMSSMPSADAGLLDVGLCAVSSCMDAAQEMLDIAVYHQEKLGSRPARQILYSKTGISIKRLQDALMLANTKLDSQGLERFARTLVIGPATDSNATPIELALLDLSSVPDGFDRQQATMLDVAVISSAFGLDMRDLSHAFGVAGTTMADAQIQHMKTGFKGVAQFLNDFAFALTPKILPGKDNYDVVFDYVDDSQDEQAAGNRKVRAEGRNLDLANTSITVRIAREQMLEEGELSEEQFGDMELAEGRLADGLDVLMLFQSQDTEIRRILGDMIENPLDIQPGANLDTVINERYALAWERFDTAPNANIKRKMRQAMAALNKLRTVTQPPPTADRETGRRGEGETRGGDDEGEEDSEPEPAAFVKGLHTKQDEDLDDLMAEYGDELDSLVTAANGGKISQSKFNKEMEAIVAALLMAAFLRGSRLSEEGLSKRLRAEVGEEIKLNLDAVRGLSDDIYAGRYKPDELGEEGADRRVELWVGTLGMMYAQGQMHRRDDPKFAWRTGSTESCETCASLSGRVRTAKEWLAGPYYPRSRSLKCGGYRCRCYFQEV